ncbi:hypothetical protein [Enterococcus phage PEF1]
MTALTLTKTEQESCSNRINPFNKQSLTKCKQCKTTLYPM